MAKVKFDPNGCKVVANCKDPNYVRLRFSNDLNGFSKMLVIKRYPDGGYLLKHTNICKPRNVLYRISPNPEGKPWSTYTIVPIEEGGGL